MFTVLNKQVHVVFDDKRTLCGQTYKTVTEDERKYPLCHSCMVAANPRKIQKKPKVDPNANPILAPFAVKRPVKMRQPASLPGQKNIFGDQ